MKHSAGRVDFGLSLAGWLIHHAILDAGNNKSLYSSDHSSRNCTLRARQSASLGTSQLEAHSWPSWSARPFVPALKKQAFPDRGVGLDVGWIQIKIVTPIENTRCSAGPTPIPRQRPLRKSNPQVEKSHHLPGASFRSGCSTQASTTIVVYRLQPVGKRQKKCLPTIRQAFSNSKHLS